MLAQVHIYSRAHFPAFVVVKVFRSTAIGGLTAILHFDKDQGIVFPHNQIDFTAATVKIAGNKVQPLGTKIFLRLAFSRVTALQ